MMPISENDKLWLKRYGGLLTEDEEKVVKKKVGHLDSEPESLQRELLKVAKYGEELKDMMDKFPNGDIPSWIQKKIVLASDYLSTVKHYLEYEIEEK